MNNEIKALEAEIASLPRGYISNKKISGKVRHYLQWSENGKVKSQYIPDNEYEQIKQGIQRRKELQKELKNLTSSSRLPKNNISKTYEMNIITGKELKDLVSNVKSFEKRDCFTSLETYLYSKVTPRVCSIYGLRRTGKTTLLYQAIEKMTEENFLKTAYIKARKQQTMAMLDSDLRQLYDQGYRFIFIDEITFLDDFVDTASFLADIYAGMGMKIVLSGKDSLGFWFTENEELYDRTYTIHTTWIPYSEHSRLLGINDIDEYIRFGGTLRAGEADFWDNELKSEEVSFRDDESTRRYIDTSISKNIQHSLKCYENGTHFRHLQQLFEANELTGAINRIIESMNHRFVISVLNSDFESSDLKLSKKNLLKERNIQLRSNILDKIDTQEVTKRLMGILEIKNQDTRSIQITNIHIQEIEEYLKALELIEDYPLRYDFEKYENPNKLFLQPGMRYCQAQALVYSLKNDMIFKELNIVEREYVCEKILSEVKGRMLEEIVLFETMKKVGTNYEVFKYQFAKGEFDMVIYDKKQHICSIYEIKHSKEQTSEQAAHLMNQEKCQRIENLFGKIAGRYILYRGKTQIINSNIEYYNVSEYLKRLPKIPTNY